MATTKRKTPGSGYNESSIEHVDGLDAVRLKPGMYLGARGPQMVFRCVKELVDNATDEYMAGRNNEVEVIFHPEKNCYIVADKAEGIPVGMNSSAKMSTLTLVFTKLHAGGKLRANSSSAYKGGSAGTHGVGAAAANAVSDSFEVWTYRDGSCWHQSFSKGKALQQKPVVKSPPSDVLKLLANKKKQGTIIRIMPDQSIVSTDGGKSKARIDVKAAFEWLENISAVNANLKITAVDVHSKNTKVFHNKTGIAVVLDTRKETLAVQEVLSKPVVYDDGVLAVAVQWCDYAEDDGVLAFASSSLCSDGGTHVDEFFNALTKSIAPFKGAKDKYQPKDLRVGLVGAINYRLGSPEFNSQVKAKLTSDLGGDCFDRASKMFTELFKKNKTLARKIIRRAVEAKKAKEEFRKAMSGISKVNAARRGVMLPNLLAMASKCSADRRELFLVEGESASGTAKKARDSSFQEVLRLQGKLANGIRMPLHQLLASKPVQNVLAAIGYVHDEKKKNDAFRISKLLLLADADPDGKHINALILTVIWRLFPQFLIDGRVFICNAPLYSSYYKGQRYFGNTHAECHAKMPKGAPKDAITRAKGWGELSPETLEIIAFHPATRNVIKILPPKTKDDQDYFIRIMNSDSTARKELLGLN